MNLTVILTGPVYNVARGRVVVAVSVVVCLGFWHCCLGNGTIVRPPEEEIMALLYCWWLTAGHIFWLFFHSFLLFGGVCACVCLVHFEHILPRLDCLVGWLAGHINKAQDERRYNKQSIEILKIPINKTIKNIVSTRTPIPSTENPSLSKGLHRKFHHETIELCLPCALIFSSSVFIYSFFFIFTRIFWHTRTNTHRTQIGIFKVVWGTEVQKREWICTRSVQRSYFHNFQQFVSIEIFNCQITVISCGNRCIDSEPRKYWVLKR